MIYTDIRVMIKVQLMYELIKLIFIGGHPRRGSAITLRAWHGGWDCLGGSSNIRGGATRYQGLLRLGWHPLSGLGGASWGQRWVSCRTRWFIRLWRGVRIWCQVRCSAVRQRHQPTQTLAVRL